MTLVTSLYMTLLDFKHLVFNGFFIFTWAIDEYGALFSSTHDTRRRRFLCWSLLKNRVTHQLHFLKNIDGHYSVVSDAYVMFGGDIKRDVSMRYV